MKTLTTLGTLIIAIAVGIFVMSLKKPGKISPNSRVVSTAEPSFNKGREFANAEAPDLENCKTLNGQSQILCIEGFFYQDASNRFANRKPRDAAYDSRALVQKIPLYRYPLWAIALGFAASHAGIAPADVKEVFFHETLWQYFVDGWGHMNVERNGSAGALAMCEKTFAGTPELDICVWGVGRGVFFFENENAAVLQTHPRAAAGFQFATDFSRDGNLSTEELTALPVSPKKTAQVAKLQVFEKPVDPALKETDECLRTKHLLACSGG